MLSFGWFPLGRQLPSPPVPLMILLLQCQQHQWQLIHSSLSCSIVFFQFPSKVAGLILLFIFFQFYSVVSRISKVDNFASSLFFLLIIIMSGLLAEIRWSVCMSKSHRSLRVSFARTGAWLCIYHFFVWSNLNFLHIIIIIIIISLLRVLHTSVSWLFSSGKLELTFWSFFFFAFLESMDPLINIIKIF